ncbi:MAG: YihY/virulence factor BrkB family protein [Pseudomonadota bacterium]
MVRSLASALKQLIEAACRKPVVGLLLRAALHRPHGHAKDMAASIAFFTFLSLFPLLLGLLALASSVLKSEQMRDRLIDWVNGFFPVGAQFVTHNIESLVRLRGAASLASALVLLWSARKMVGAISRGINQALGQKRTHALYLSPLRNFGLVVAVSLLIFGTTAITPLANILSDFELAFLGKSSHAVIDLVGGHLVSVASTGAMIGFTYLLMPYQRPGWSRIWPGIVTATLLIEVGKSAFVYYVDNSSKLDALYGSISSIIVLMLWLYFFGRVLLYGAEVNAVYGAPHSQSPCSLDLKRQEDD